MNDELTPWFPADVKPARAGLYGTKILGIPYVGFSYWTGVEWFNQAPTKRGALRLAKQLGSEGAYQNKTWRGLAKAPK